MHNTTQDNLVHKLLTEDHNQDDMLSKIKKELGLCIAIKLWMDGHSASPVARTLLLIK